MAEIGSIRGGDGSIPGEDVEKKDEPKFFQPKTVCAILSAMAPTRGMPEINDLRRLVLAAEPTKTYTIPSASGAQVHVRCVWQSRPNEVPPRK